MASATASTKDSGRVAAVRDRVPRFRWRGFGSLGTAILCVNLFALLVLAGGVLYLDSFRSRLIEQRRVELASQAQLAATLADGSAASLARLQALRSTRGTRVRLYGVDGRLLADNWRNPGAPRFEIQDPDAAGWRRRSARLLDQLIESVGPAEVLDPYAEPSADNRAAWPEAETAARGRPSTRLRRAVDRTVIVSAAAPLPGRGLRPVVLVTEAAADVTRIVRDERLTSFQVFLGVLAVSLALSAFLARTIVRPLRLLAIAAHRVRLGRSREVQVPRFAKRRDEIGALARAVADMSQALRHRIDSTEAFAADVAHELKNPLASLRSAVDVFERVKEPGQRAQLLEVIRDDVGRIDRLITDISDASRIDAELSRAGFSRVDLGDLVGTLVRYYEAAGLPRGVRLAFARPERESALVVGEPERLGRVFRNLLDNAISFSPDGGVVEVAVEKGANIVARVADEGPGVPPEAREAIFERFYSERPDPDSFGRHSGLGLSIARTIVEAHDGAIRVEPREEGSGARFVVELPAA